VSRILCWLVIMAGVQGAALYGGAHVILNGTPSLPMGLYWRLARPAALEPGMLVELSPPDAVIPFMEQLPVGAHLLKQIAGGPGDMVCWRTEEMAVNGFPVAQRRSPRPLAVVVVGCRTLAEDDLVVIGQHPQSLDSRDIGPIDRRRVLYRVVPVWTWGATS